MCGDGSPKIPGEPSYFRRIFEESGDAIFIAHPDGHYFDVNPCACALLGYSRSELLQMSVSDIVCTEELKDSRESFDRLNSGEPLKGQAGLRRKDGSQLIAEFTAVPLSDGMLLSFVRDVTSHHAYLTELEDSERRFRTVVETSPDCIVIINEALRITFINRRGAPVGLEAAIGTDFLDNVLEEYRAKFAHAVSAVGSESPFTHLNWWSTEGRYLNSRFAAMPGDLHGGGVLLITRDETEQFKLLEMLVRRDVALDKSKEQFRSFAENSSDIVARHAPDGTFIYVSPAGERLLGYAAEDVLGRTAGDFIHPDDLEIAFESVKAAIAGGELPLPHYRVRRSDGTYAWVETNFQRVESESGDYPYESWPCPATLQAAPRASRPCAIHSASLPRLSTP